MEIDGKCVVLGLSMFRCGATRRHHVITVEGDGQSILELLGGGLAVVLIALIANRGAKADNGPMVGVADGIAFPFRYPAKSQHVNCLSQILAEDAAALNHE